MVRTHTVKIEPFLALHASNVLHYRIDLA